jgi:predicted MFS family arabinose efflux permease
VAFSTVTYMKLAAEWVSSNRYAFVSGLLATATMAGAVFGELPLSYFINHYGWRECLLFVGIAGFLLSFLFLSLVRESNTSIQKGSITLNDLFSVLKNKKNWLLTLYGGLAFSPISIFAGLWGNPFLQQAYHFSKTESASMISLIFIGLGIGSPIIGFIASKMENKLQIMFYSTVIAFISLSLVLFYQPMPKVLLGCLLFIFGFGLGAYLLAFTIGKDANKAVVTATVIAMINAGDALLTGITEPLIGKLLDVSWNGQLVDGVRYFSLTDYRMALGLLPAYLLVASLLTLSLQEKTKEVKKDDVYHDIHFHKHIDSLQHRPVT